MFRKSFFSPSLHRLLTPKKEDEDKKLAKLETTVSINRNPRRPLLTEERDTLGRLDCVQRSHCKFLRSFSVWVVALWAVSCAHERGTSDVNSTPLSGQTGRECSVWVRAPAAGENTVLQASYNTQLNIELECVDVSCCFGILLSAWVMPPVPVGVVESENSYSVPPACTRMHTAHTLMYVPFAGLKAQSPPQFLVSRENKREVGQSGL